MLEVESCHLKWKDEFTSGTSDAECAGQPAWKMKELILQVEMDALGAV